MVNGIELKIKEYLKSYRKKTISLEELSSLFSGNVLYAEFAEAVSALITTDTLHPIKSAGISSRNPRLPYKYKIKIGTIREEYKNDIERTAVVLHKKINLDYYFTSPQSDWEDDKQNIIKLDRYLKSAGFPQNFADTPERSFHVFGDEKFIDEKHGKRLLQRLRLYDEMKISEGCDPAMFYINSEKFDINIYEHKHLIIENRTAFYAIAEILRGSALTSLIYGAGFKILSSVAMFEKQLDLSGCLHKYFYFGDLDYTGISIWSYVSDRVGAVPVRAFYKALLAHEPAIGKEYQIPNENAVSRFLDYFDLPEKNRILKALDNGRYYPQETLSKAELQQIFTKCGFSDDVLDF